MKEITVTISDLNRSCEHPCSELVRTACQFQSRILLSCGNKQVNAKSIMGIMAFDLSAGASVTVTTQGEDEDSAAEAIEAFLLCR